MFKIKTLGCGNRLERKKTLDWRLYWKALIFKIYARITSERRGRSLPYRVTFFCFADLQRAGNCGRLQRRRRVWRGLPLHLGEGRGGCCAAVIVAAHKEKISAWSATLELTLVLKGVNFSPATLLWRYPIDLRPTRHSKNTRGTKASETEYVIEEWTTLTNNFY